MLFGLMASLFAGCNMDIGERGDGNIITESQDVGDFNAILLRGGFEIILVESNNPGVTISTDQNLMDLIKVEVNDGVLEISSLGNIRPTDGSSIRISYPELNRIDVAGAAEVHAENVITGRDFSLHMSGAGEVDLELDLQYLEIDVSGAGSIELSGSVDRQRVSMSGAGGYDGKELRSHECTISISGVGGAAVYADEKITANVSGIGGVEYFGNPSDVQTDVSGLGSIDAGDEKDAM